MAAPTAVSDVYAEIVNRYNARCAASQPAPARLIAAYPSDLSKEELADRASQSPTSSGYSNNLGALRSLGFLDYPVPGRVKAADILFL